MPGKKRQVLCKVCFDDTRSIFYGAVCCNACRSFFRRKVLQGNLGPCRQKQECEINMNSRHWCSWCRFQKCVKVGMQKELVEGEAKRKIVSINDSPSSLPNSPPDSSPCSQVSQGSSFVAVEETWIKKSIGSRIEFKVIYAKVIKWRGTPSYIYETLVEVAVKNGIIVGTKIKFHDLIRNLTSPDMNSFNSSSDTLMYKTSSELVTFQRSDNSSNKFTPFHDCIFDVQMVKFSSETIILESLSDYHWEKLREVCSSSRHLRLPMRVIYHDVPLDYSLEIVVGNERKQLLLTVGMENYTKCISTAFGELPFYQSLPLEDQVILIKDGVMEVGLLILLQLYDRTENSFLRKVIDGHLIHGIHFDVIRGNKDIENLYHEMLSEEFDILRQDSFVVDLLSFLLFLTDRPGITEGAVIVKERNHYAQLLDKYVQGQIRSGVWNEDYDLVWNKIKLLLSMVCRVIRLVVDACQKANMLQESR